MNIGILGSGQVAKALAEGFLRHKHAVTLGTRDNGKLSDWLQRYPAAKAGSFAEAARFGEVVVLAVKGLGAEAALAAAGAAHLAGKTVIDATNPIDDAPPDRGVVKFFTKADESLMEKLQRQFPDAHFVKAFNSVGAMLMVNPKLASRPTMFICGNDAAAKRAVGAILDQFGWEVEDMGDAVAARAIEPLCILWCIPGFLHNDWNHAFKLLR